MLHLHGVGRCESMCDDQVKEELSWQLHLQPCVDPDPDPDHDPFIHHCIGVCLMNFVLVMWRGVPAWTAFACLTCIP